MNPPSTLARKLPFTALACLALGLGLSLPGLAEEKDAAFSVSHPLPTPPAQIVVPMKFGGAERLFIFDTGSDGTTIDPSLQTPEMRAAGEASVHDGTSGKRITAKMVHLPDFTDQSHTFTGGTGTLLSTEMLSLYTGRPLAGILGIAQFGEAKIFLDYREAKLTIHNGGWKLPSGQATEIALNPGRKAPEITASLGDRSVAFTIDTGYNGALSLSPADFAALVKSGLIQETGAGGRNLSVTQESATKKGVFQGGTLMGKELKGLPVFSGPSLGLGWLCAFQIELDLKERQLRYLPIEHPQEPVLSDLMLGAILIYKDGQALVAQLQPGGKGSFEKAGLKANDLLLRVDILQKSELHQAALLRLLAAKAGQPIEIEYQRGGSATPSKIDFTLPPLITEWGKHQVRNSE